MNTTKSNFLTHLTNIDKDPTSALKFAIKNQTQLNTEITALSNHLSNILLKDGNWYEKCAIAILLPYKSTSAILNSHNKTALNVAIEASRRGDVKVFAACFEKAKDAEKTKILKEAKKGLAHPDIIKYCFKNHGFTKEDATPIALLTLVSNGAFSNDDVACETIRYLVEEKGVNTSLLMGCAVNAQVDDEFEEIIDFLDSRQNLDRLTSLTIALPLILGGATAACAYFLSTALVVQIAVPAAVFVASLAILGAVLKYSDIQHKSIYSPQEPASHARFA